MHETLSALGTRRGRLVAPSRAPADPPKPTTPPLSDTGHDAVEAVTWQVRVAAAWSWRLIVIAAGVHLLVKVSIDQPLRVAIVNNLVGARLSELGLEAR